MKAKTQPEDVRQEFERLLKEAMKQPGVCAAQEAYRAYHEQKVNYDRFAGAGKVPAVPHLSWSCS